MDDLGEVTRQLREALGEMLVKKDAFKDACIEAEGYMIKEREALRQRYEVELSTQRKSGDKYMRDALDKETRLKEVCIFFSSLPLWQHGNLLLLAVAWPEQLAWQRKKTQRPRVSLLSACEDPSLCYALHYPGRR